MSNIVSVPNTMTEAALEHVLLKGDLSKLNEKERISYIMAVCSTIGLNHLTRPFEYIVLNGRLTLYARKDATDQLRKIHKVSIRITNTKKIDDIYIVEVSAMDVTGREDAATGAVNVAGLKGDALANAFLKAETKAKRRVTLSICGLGILDESEVDSIPREEKAKVVRDIASAPQESSARPAQLSEYLITFGKYANRTLGDIPIKDLEDYVRYLEAESAKRRKPLEGRGLELVQAARAYLEEQS